MTQTHINKASKSRFAPGGLRSFLEYRDLGVRAATSGRWRASLSRSTQAMPGGTGTHRHQLETQFIYVLNGAATFEYADFGEVSVIPGDCIFQPSTIVHQQTDRSRDCVILEVVSPAEFPTIEAPLEPYVSPGDGAGQRFNVVHAAEVGYTPHPFRPWMVRRDLGIAHASDGRVLAQLSRVADGLEPVAEMRASEFDFYMLFGLQGHCRINYDDGQNATILPGDCVTFAPGCNYEIIDCESGFECLEVLSLAS
jgi:uncharacterized RmlC-like cupin family protein